MFSTAPTPPIRLSPDTEIRNFGIRPQGACGAGNQGLVIGCVNHTSRENILVRLSERQTGSQSETVLIG
ncbi:hypothetical protein Hamer_G013554 [Homarus americanus]|uniref:Uncharacterized protein n=1 Tax=Homarus americanus TaxID=6706 RepID=A0A8J5N0E3_HOMAM|nr:hypothetical protein Hamer_G013554 [Homarus americanus]